MTFLPQAQGLVFASNAKKDQLRVAQLPSGHVYTNWPTQRTPLGQVSCVDVSPNGGYMAVGNHRGKALLFKLKGYDHA
jgi:U3 small nucleolar RNA-associated protein 18